jgi:hypothetical protein
LSRKRIDNFYNLYEGGDRGGGSTGETPREQCIGGEGAGREQCTGGEGSVHRGEGAMHMKERREQGKRTQLKSNLTFSSVHIEFVWLAPLPVTSKLHEMFSFIASLDIL